MACSTSKLDILLADGKTKLVSDLKVGDEVDTLHQHTFQRGKHKVVFVETKKSKLLSLTFLGETFECSPTHRFYSKDKGEWIEAKDLVEGDKVISLDGEIEFISSEEIEDGDVVDLTVEGAHTYISGNILSHNKGDTYNAPPPPPPDTTFKDYLKYQTERTEDEGYKDWTNQLQTYKSKKGKQASGRSGWDDFKTGVKNKLGQGLLTYGEAETQLKDYAKDYNLAPDTVSWSGGVDPRKSWERNKDKTDFSYTDSPTYETPEEWKDWSVNKALTDLNTYYTGGDDGGLQGRNRDLNIRTAYEQLLGRKATEDEVTKGKSQIGKNKYYQDIESFKAGLTSGSEYKKKFSNSYLENYYDEMYGAQGRDDDGNKTGKRTFSFDKTLLPTYKGEAGTTGSKLETDTGVALPGWQDSFTGSPAEIDFNLDNIRESRKFLYSAGLTNLQGTIDGEIQKLKNEGGKEITKIKSEGDILGNLVGSFSF